MLLVAVRIVDFMFRATFSLHKQKRKHGDVLIRTQNDKIQITENEAVYICIQQSVLSMKSCEEKFDLYDGATRPEPQQ